MCRSEMTYRFESYTLRRVEGCTIWQCLSAVKNSSKYLRNRILQFLSVFGDSNQTFPSETKKWLSRLPCVRVVRERS